VDTLTSIPYAGAAEYIAVCLPAFDPQLGNKGESWLFAVLSPKKQSWIFYK